MSFVPAPSARSEIIDQCGCCVTQSNKICVAGETAPPPRSSRNSLLGLLEEAPGRPSAKRERRMAVLVMSTDAGDFAIQEDEVSTITAAELCQLRISRVDLRRLFAEAAKLLLGIKPRDQ